MESLITLRGLLSTISSTKTITINLYDQEGLLIISFGLPGYAALEDELELSTVKQIIFLFVYKHTPNLITVKLKLL